ncbi:MAG: hypothetical protein KDB27_16260 [Planctomycetales bacterium]|nr:hypothetical protein [Planctomycetales bacterium]
MAREESYREDLIREATGLVDRVEYEVESTEEPVVVGFRRDGSISFFFGQDRVYQFNRHNELRRGYLNGKLLKAENGTLVFLTRERTETQVQLLRHELTEREQQTIIDEAKQNIAKLKTAIEDGTACESRSVSQDDADEPARERVLRWLQSWSGVIAVAASARVSDPR